MSIEYYNDKVEWHSVTDLTMCVYCVTTCRPGQGHIVVAARLQLVLTFMVGDRRRILPIKISTLQSPKVCARKTCKEHGLIQFMIRKVKRTVL